ncbi:MAG TPA: hypothetical protein VK752_08880 [Bryobacteraceae bacterium]|jgi:hypothetical protein|nr:hypothetical protein [Bryobacteraceae bacterium]
METVFVLDRQVGAILDIVAESDALRAVKKEKFRDSSRWTACRFWPMRSACIRGGPSASAAQLHHAPQAPEPWTGIASSTPANGRD